MRILLEVFTMSYTLEDAGIKLLSGYEDYRQKIEAAIRQCRL
jgi:hypothetical protein